MSPRVAVLVPLKVPARAKTRLQAEELAEAGVGREDLMRAFARDVCTAARAAAGVQVVHVVTEAADLIADLDRAPDGVAKPAALEFLPDEGYGDLNEALARAAARVRSVDPDVAVAAVCGDLPCLLPGDLDAVLSALGPRREFVPDAEGTGTTMLVAPPGVELDPHFGVGSAQRHEGSGAQRREDAPASLRRDVDTEADLRAALSLGVGEATSRLLASRGLRDRLG